ncbi:unnamed protein product [Victoria cruziana]
MGAKVQCNGYLPAYYHMKDLNDDVRSAICSQFYEDKIFRGGQYCNGFMQQSTDGCSEYDKEALKQTMLKHEAIFRKQVSELHRLYRVQRDLMNDLKRNKISTYSLQMEAVSDSQQFLQINSIDSSRIWQASMPSVIGSSSSRLSVSDIKRACTPLDFLKDNSVQTVPIPTHNIKQEVCGPLNLQRNKNARRSIDLQLPADEYIDIEDDELSVKEVKVPDHDVVPESEVKLTLGTGYHADVKSGCKKSSIYSADGFHGHQISGSKSSCEDACHKDIATSSFKIPGIFHGEHQARQLPVDPSPIGLLKDCVIEDSNRRYWNFLESEYKGTEVGRDSSNFAPEHYRSPSAPFSQNFTNNETVDSKKSREPPAFVLSDRGQKESWPKDTEMLMMNVAVTNSARDIRPTSLSGTSSAVARSDQANCGSLEISWKRSKSTTNPLAFGTQSQAHFDGSTRRDLPDETTFQPFQSTESYEEKFYLGGTSRPHQGLSHEVPHCNSIGLSKTEASGSRSCSFLGLEKSNLDTDQSFTNGHPEDNGPRKIMKEFDYEDVKARKNVALSLALPHGSGDDSCLNSGRDLHFSKGKDDNPFQRQFVSPVEAKAQANNTASVNCGSAQTGEGLSRVFHLPLSCINLEEPSNIKYETGGWICDAAKVSLPKNDTGFLQELSSLQANKNDLAIVSEIQETSGLLSNGLNFLKEPLADKPNKDRSKFEEQDNVQERQGSTLSGLKIQNVEKLALVGRASGHSARQEITSTASSFHDGKSICLGEGEHKFSPSFKMEFLAKGREVLKEDKAGQDEPKMVTIVRDEIPQHRRKVPQNRRIDLPDTDRNGGENDWIDLGLPGDSVKFQTHAGPMQMAQNVLHLQGSSNIDCSVAGDNFCVGDHACSTEPSDALISMAAEVLMLISAVANEKADCVIPNEPEATSNDPLEWLADVACSDAAAQPEASSAISGGKVDNHPQSSDEEDFFEAMTLMLTDTKMDVDYCYKSHYQIEELRGPETDASPGPNQPSRRTSRRGRRQRDFQREILPGLMSLSRHEVTEDMQTLGGLMKASGCFWQTGLARKNGYKNGWGSPTKGRRSRSVAMEANEAVLAVLQSACDAEVDENGGLKGLSWGKTTRRRRRMQRSRITAAPASCITKK